MTTPQPAALPELIRMGYEESSDNPDDWRWQLAHEAERLAALQSQPAAAGVSDAEILSAHGRLFKSFLIGKERDNAIKFARAILALRPQAESERVDAIMAHVHDLYAELGLKWGDNPFLALSRLRPQAVPMTHEQIRALLTEAGYDDANVQARADFINGARYAEAHHGITTPAGGEGK